MPNPAPKQPSIRSKVLTFQKPKRRLKSPPKPVTSLEKLLLKKSKASAKITLASLERLAQPKKQPKEHPHPNPSPKSKTKARLSPKNLASQKPKNAKPVNVVNHFGELMKKLEKQHAEVARDTNGEIISYMQTTDLNDLKDLPDDVDEFIKEYIEAHENDVVKYDFYELGGLVMFWCLNYILSDGINHEGYRLQLERLSQILYPYTMDSSMVWLHPQSQNSSTAKVLTNESGKALSALTAEAKRHNKKGISMKEAEESSETQRAAAAQAFKLEEGYMDRGANKQLVAGVRKTIEAMGYVNNSGVKKYLLPDFALTNMLFTVYKRHKEDAEEERKGKTLKTLFAHARGQEEVSSEEELPGPFELMKKKKLIKSHKTAQNKSSVLQCNKSGAPKTSKNEVQNKSKSGVPSKSKSGVPSKSKSGVSSKSKSGAPEPSKSEATESSKSEASELDPSKSETHDSSKSGALYYWSDEYRSILPTANPAGPLKSSYHSKYLRPKFDSGTRFPDSKHPELDLTVYGVSIHGDEAARKVYKRQDFSISPSIFSNGNEESAPDVEEEKKKTPAASKSSKPRYMRSIHHFSTKFGSGFSSGIVPSSFRSRRPIRSTFQSVANESAKFNGGEAKTSKTKPKPRKK